VQLWAKVGKSLRLLQADEEEVAKKGAKKVGAPRGRNGGTGKRQNQVCRPKGSGGGASDEESVEEGRGFLAKPLG